MEIMNTFGSTKNPLHIIFGRENCPSEYILDTRIYFRKHKKPEWFENEDVKEFLLGVEGTTVLFEEALKDRDGHGISTEMICTGCKTLCDILFGDENLIYNGSAMGDNCIPYLMKIAEKRNITIFLEHYMDFPEVYFDEKRILFNGRFLTQDEYDEEFCKYCEANSALAETKEDDGIE